MVYGYHLWEVDHSDSVLAIHHQVKLIEISMYDATVAEPHNEFHALAVHCGGVLELVDLAPEGHASTQM